MAKFTNSQPFKCPHRVPTLKKSKKNERFKKPMKQKAYEISHKYNFHDTKVDKIFDQLFIVGQLK